MDYCPDPRCESLECRRQYKGLYDALLKSQERIAAMDLRERELKTQLDAEEAKRKAIEQILRPEILQQQPPVVPRQRRPIGQAVLTDQKLIDRFNAVFAIKPTANAHNDKKLYKALLASVPPSEREALVESIYRACHNGNDLPAGDRIRVRQGKILVGKGSFANCLRAFGGEFRVIKGQNAWENVHIKQGIRTYFLARDVPN